MDTPAFLRPYEIREGQHRIHDPLSEDKLATLGRALRLSPGDRLLDLACGSGEMLCTWARDHGVTGTGVDLSGDFIAAATARAHELGVADRVDFVHADAAGHTAPTAYDVVSCLGATWIGGGLAGTLALMEQSLRPGGLVLVGEPYWAQEPPDEEAVRGCHAESREDFMSLPGLVRELGSLGWDVVEMVLASQDDWDRYAAAQWLTTRRWLDEHPDDELAPELRTELDTAAWEHVSYQRAYLGWGVFALTRR
ncbi:MAG TPA: methyltransferase domain-containing protein [Nocardioides sp.]|nr:methyltransferase domain-containing protein [Nocardioides sp.]